MIKLGVSDKIEAFICELLKAEQKDYLEFGRNELAELFNCVPSQINYVLNTRFNSASGYLVESKRGGSGYLRIYKLSKDSVFSDIYERLKAPLSYKECSDIIRALFSSGTISENTSMLMLSAVSDKSIPPENNLIRTNVLKNMIYSIK